MTHETFIGDCYVNATEHKSGEIKINFDTLRYNHMIFGDSSKSNKDEISSKIFRHMSTLFPEYHESINENKEKSIIESNIIENYVLKKEKLNLK